MRAPCVAEHRKLNGRVYVACSLCGSPMEAEVGRQIDLRRGWNLWWRCPNDHLSASVPLPERVGIALERITLRQKGLLRED